MHRVSRPFLVALAIFALILGLSGSTLAHGPSAPLAYDETPGGMVAADLSRIPGTYQTAQYGHDGERRARGLRNCNNNWNQCITMCNMNPNADASVKAMCVNTCNVNRTQCVRQVERAVD